MVEKKIKDLVLKYNLGALIDIELLKSSQNKVYKVRTNNGSYVIKEYTKDAIGNYYYLKKRKEQIRISEILNKKGIKTIIPLIYNNRKFIFYQNKYYLIYNFYESIPKTSHEMTTQNIKQLAKTQAKIHKLNIKSTLQCSYRNIDVDLEKQLRILFKKNKESYEVLYKNKEKLNIIISNCNKYIKKMKKNLCINHNDYKLLNILWEEGEPILIDFDATGLSNPACSLCESAFTFSKYSTYIKYDFYEEYLKAYFKEYGLIKEQYIEALYASFNGKLQWLKYMFSKNHLKNNNYITEIVSMIEELVLYYDNIEKFNTIFIKVQNEFLDDNN